MDVEIYMFGPDQIESQPLLYICPVARLKIFPARVFREKSNWTQILFKPGAGLEGLSKFYLSLIMLPVQQTLDGHRYHQ